MSHLHEAPHQDTHATLDLSLALYTYIFTQKETGHVHSAWQSMLKMLIKGYNNSSDKGVVFSSQEGFSSLAHSFTSADSMLHEKRDSLTKHEDLYGMLMAGHEEWHKTLIFFCQCLHTTCCIAVRQAQSTPCG